MNTTTAAAARYFRTAKGSHVHADFECANQRRAIALGDPIECGIDEMAPCEHCMPTGAVAAHLAQLAAKQDTMCAGGGVTHPQRVQSKCKSCEKVGKVDRRTGSLRAHKPQH
jgi:hypothetical protein